MAKAITFKAAAAAYIAAHRAGWQNDKHAAQWASTLATYAEPVFGSPELAMREFDKALRKKLRDDYVVLSPPARGKIMLEAFAAGCGGGPVLDLSREQPGRGRTALRRPGRPLPAGPPPLPAGRLAR